MEFEQIKQRLQQKGCSIAIIARALNKSHTSVTQVAKGKTTSKSIATAIAKACDESIEIVFPDTPSYHQELPFQTKTEQEEYWQEHLAS